MCWRMSQKEAVWRLNVAFLGPSSTMFSAALLFIVIVFLQLPACRTKFSPTSQWQANVTQSLEDRLNAAYLSLFEVRLRPEVNITSPRWTVWLHDIPFGYSQFYTALANFELASQHNSTFREMAIGYFQTDISQYFQTWEQGNEGNATLRQAMDHGYAAIRWYKAYGNASFLQAAQACWNLAYSLTISDQT
ncbi:hypothetical protein PM082_003196 [Marasmius tenuissimus]|nr:hypothetical protein PM082_003196 [Marasmius tenuissimus]